MGCRVAKVDGDASVFDGMGHAADVVLHPFAEMLFGDDAMGGEAFFGAAFDVEDGELRLVIVGQASSKVECHDGDGRHVRGIEDAAEGLGREIGADGDLGSEDENGMARVAEDLLGNGAGDPLADASAGAGGEDQEVGCEDVKFVERVVDFGLADDGPGVNVRQGAFVEEAVEFLGGAFDGFLAGGMKEDEIGVIPAAEGGDIVEGGDEIIFEVGENGDAFEWKDTVFQAKHRHLCVIHGRMGGDSNDMRKGECAGRAVTCRREEHCGRVCRLWDTP